MSNWRKFILLGFGTTLLVDLAVFFPVPPPAPVKPLPVPNGYETLVRAGRMVSGLAPGYLSMDHEQLAALVADNTNALQLARTGFTQVCRVPVRFSEAWFFGHHADLLSLRLLREALRAEGRQSERLA